MKVRYTSDYPQEKAAHTRALAAPQRFPMMGDSAATRAEAMRGYRYANQLPAMRARLVEARYADWQNTFNVEG